MRNLPALNGNNGHNGAKVDSPNGVVQDANGGQLQTTDAGGSTKMIRAEAFDQPVILQQTSLWSRSIVWAIVGVTSFALIWASVARLEEAVPATGKLESKESTQDVQAPVAGVVDEILVTDGEQVQKGDVLVRFDPTAAIAQKQSLEQIRNSLQLENAFYRSQLSGVPVAPQANGQLRLPAEMLSLTMNRAALFQENQLYRAQLTGSTQGLTLSAEQQARLQTGMMANQTAIAAARFEIAQLEEQFRQAQGQLEVASKSLDVDQSIVNDVRPLVEEGALGRIQMLRQEQEVMQGRGEVERLRKEVTRIQAAIAQARERYQNTIAQANNDVLTKISDNEKRIADIDSQLNKAIVENEKRIAEINSQLSQADLTLRYQELRAPVTGTVFDLQAKGPGFVANPSEPIMKIVPTEALVARVEITNQDIGFVKEGMPVDVRIDSFPFSEFGDIKGTVTNIGSDALPPDQVHPFYRFPVEVTMEQQYLSVRGTNVPLQSGMSVSTNIITRDRTVMSIFTDLFSRRIESLKNTR